MLRVQQSLFLLILFSLSIPAFSYVAGSTKFGIDKAMGTPGMRVNWTISASVYGDTELEDFMPEGFETEISRAFDTWSSVADIDFVQVSEDSGYGNIFISGTDLPNPYIGEATYPKTLSPGYILFDTGQNWSTNGDGQSSKDIFSVALHEIGHNLGLYHNNEDINSIMFPAIGFKGAVDGLSEDDIAGAQYIYGPRVSEVPIPAAAWLFGSALIGLAGIGRKRRA